MILGSQRAILHAHTVANMRMIRLGIHRWLDLTSDFTAFFYRLILAGTWAFLGLRFVLHTTGKLRRFWLVHFRKEYVQGQLLVRRGECWQCGACCNLLFTCPMLTKHGKCFVYGSCRPQVCKVFPIDQRDIDEVNLRSCHCGYRFDKKS